jgi:hypothetical protein
MSFVQKSLAVVAVFGFLALAPKASAQFTPPSSLTPFLPASNVVTIKKVASVGAYTIYSCSMGGLVTVPTSYSLAAATVVASSNCSWTEFKAATVGAGSQTNSAVLTVAQNWWNANISFPYYSPLLAAAQSASAKTASAALIRRR